MAEEEIDHSGAEAEARNAQEDKEVVIADDAQDEDGEEEDGALDDLFGDDGGDESGADSKPADEDGIVHDSDEEDDEVISRRRRALDDDDDEDNEDQFLVQEHEEPRELRITDEEVIRHPPKFHYGETTYIAKVPRFLHVQPSRFDSGDYLGYLEELKKDTQLDNDSKALKRLHDENTVRWRYTTKEGEETLSAESNAQFVEWSDGSFSLKLGGEYFDVLESTVNETFLVTTDASKPIENDGSTLYLADGAINKSMKFVPTSTKSQIHKKLTTAIQARQQTKPGAQSVVVEIDPEKESRRLEKQFEDRVRERRRQMLKLEKEQEKGGLGSSNGGSVNRSYTREYRNVDNYDDEDGFVVEEDDEDEDEAGFDDDDDDDLEDVDEDDEDEEAAERLKRVKQLGSEQYGNDSVARKKRRVIDDDEDDE